MPALVTAGRQQQPSLADAVRGCKSVVGSIAEAAKQARLFTDECKGLVALSRRLQPLLDDLEDNSVESDAESKGTATLKTMEAALRRCHTAANDCIAMGPFFALINQDRIISEFTNASLDILASLKALDLKALKVDANQVESMALLQQQLSKLCVNFTPCVATNQSLVELRIEAEAVRCGQAQPGSQPHSQLSTKYLKDCTLGQLAADVAYLQAEAAKAQEAGKHVEAFFFNQLAALETPLLPVDAKTTKAMAHQEVVLPNQAPVEEKIPTAVDPLPLVRDLLKTLTTPDIPIEDRAKALRPLVAAAGLDPEGCTSPDLHAGAVLYALTDPECASKVVALVNEPATEPLIKGWLLAMVLSLVHPERGMNPDTQQALIQTGLPTALCRLVVRTATPPEQRLQALTMLRVLAADPATHPAMIEAKVLHTLVQQISDVLVIKGQVVGHTRVTAPVEASPAKAVSRFASTATTNTTAATGTGTATLGTGSGFDLEQQNIELAVLLIADMAPGSFKAEILSAGGVKALVQCCCEVKNAERVRAAAATALAVLLTDGAIAVEAARDDLLVGLVSLLTSQDPACQQAALAAAQQLLTPTPPSSAEIAAAVNASVNAPVVSLPPQGKAAKLAATKPTTFLTTSSAPSTAQTAQHTVTTVTASGAAAGQAQAGGATDAALSSAAAQSFFQAMGKVLSPASTSSMMDLLALSNPTLIPLALSFLPLTATDPACRAAILNHLKGMPVLLREAGKSNAGAVSALNKVAGDLGLKAQCASIITQALIGAAADLDSQCNLAAALAAAGEVPTGSEKDKAALSAAADFASEVYKAGGVTPLVSLLKRNEPLPKVQGIRALRMLAVYGDAQVKDAILKAEALVHLTEAIKMEAPAGSAINPSQAACEALSALAAAEPVRSQVFSSLLGYLASPSTASFACLACLQVAGSSTDAFTALAKAGVIPPLLIIMGKVTDAELAQPCRLLAALVASSAETADLADTADACTVIPLALEKGNDVARTAAASAACHVMRRSEKARNQVVDRKGLTMIMDLLRTTPATNPYYEDLASAVAVLCINHEASRYDISRALRSSLLRGTDAEQVSAAAVATRLAHGAKGREILFSDELVDPLIKLLGQTGCTEGQKLAADALIHLASAGTVTLTPAAGATGDAAAASVLNTKSVLINKGCINGLSQMLKSNNEAVICEAAVCLEGLCSVPEGLKAAKTARAQDSLSEVIQAGKKGEVSERTSKAAYAAYLKLI